MTERARREYAEVLRRRYVVANKRERGRILDECCPTTHCHRKAAIRRLGQQPRARPGGPPGARCGSGALGSLRAQIPLRTGGEGAGVAPGALQGDLVLHCGESTDGFSLATLVAIDVVDSFATYTGAPNRGLSMSRLS